MTGRNYSPEHYLLAADLLPHAKEEIARVSWHDLEASLELHAHGRIPLACADTRRELAIAREVGLVPEDGVEDRVCAIELSKIVAKLLADLHPREEKVLRMRFGFDGGDGATLEAVGKRFGLHKTRIRQIEAKAILKLRHTSRARLLKPHTEWSEL